MIRMHRCCLCARMMNEHDEIVRWSKYMHIDCWVDLRRDKEGYKMFMKVIKAGC